jgi:REP-associated tyrosine transposase
MPCLKIKSTPKPKPMDKFQSKYRIQSARLRTWDYAKPGGYFITINCVNHEQYFGKIVKDEMLVNELGKIAFECWSEIPQHFKNAELGEFQVMPNHIHGITIITTFCYEPYVDPNQIVFQKPQIESTHFRFQHQGENTISAMVGSFKSGVTKKIHQLALNAPQNNSSISANKQFAWQSRFHDHCIRTHEEFVRILTYIRNNPGNWEKDRFYRAS